MVKKLLLLMLISLPALAMEGRGTKRRAVGGDFKVALESKRSKGPLDELRRRVEGAGSSSEAYARLISANKSSGVSVHDVLGVVLSLVTVSLVMRLI